MVFKIQENSNKREAGQILEGFPINNQTGETNGKNYFEM